MVPGPAPRYTGLSTDAGNSARYPHQQCSVRRLFDVVLEVAALPNVARGLHTIVCTALAAHAAYLVGAMHGHAAYLVAFSCAQSGSAAVPTQDVHTSVSALEKGTKVLCTGNRNPVGMYMHVCVLCAYRTHRSPVMCRVHESSLARSSCKASGQGAAAVCCRGTFHVSFSCLLRGNPHQLLRRRRWRFLCGCRQTVSCL